MSTADAARLHMDPPTNLMIVNSVLSGSTSRFD
jgi:diacylglycerol O-acyltransferase